MTRLPDSSDGVQWRHIQYKLAPHPVAGVYGNGNCGLPKWDLRGKLFPCCKLLIPLQDALNWKISGLVDFPYMLKKFSIGHKKRIELSVSESSFIRSSSAEAFRTFPHLGR